ncbi:MAG: LysM peptidoglycan-binding domain-containing protein [Oscillospiraceae bacterium]|nr:LysM peptidoglycan-binding domain-containing protein [Oscillospiraceae bacterium]
MTIYTVESGDSINSIARRFGISPLRIAADNGLRNPSQLAVGQSLYIGADNIRYVLQQGQTLYSVSQEYGVPLEALIEANPTLNPLNIRAGTTVNIPVEQPERRTAVVNGYAYPTITDSSLNCVLPFLSFISPFSYSMTPQADLIAPDDSDLLYRAVSSAVMPMMVMTNIYDGSFSTETLSAVLGDEELQEKLIANILEEVRNKNYYGVNMDMEYISPDDRERYNSFLRELTDRLHSAGYILTVALAPKISADQQGLLYEAHDYAVQGEIADYVILMTYEWGFTYGEPRAVSPIDEVRKVLDYAVTEIPPAKLLMSMPNYGYDWTLPYTRGTAAKSIGFTAATELALRYKAEIMFDEKSQTPYFNYTDAEGAAHVVWFDDPHSIYEKLLLVDEYDLAGVSWWTVNRCYVPAWLIMQELFEIQKI